VGIVSYCGWSGGGTEGGEIFLESAIWKGWGEREDYL